MFTMKGVLICSSLIFLSTMRMMALAAYEDFEEGGYGNPYGGGPGGGGYGDYGDGGYGGGEDFGSHDGGATTKPPKELTTMAEITDFLAETDIESTVIGYFDLETNKEDKIIFDEAHRIGQYRYRFGFTTNKDILSEMKYTGCALNVYRPSKFVSDKYEKVKSRFPGKSLKSSGSLIKWIEEKAIPLVGLKKLGTAGKYDDLNYPQLTVFTHVDLEKQMKQFQYYANRLRKIAKDKISKMSFNIADISEFTPLIGKYGISITTDKKTAYVGIQDGGNYYKMEKDFTSDNVKEFVDLFFSGGLFGKEQVSLDYIPPQETDQERDPYEEEEEEAGESHVVSITSSTYDELITQTNKDTMIEFYAPWCGHCKQLAPLYERVAKEMSAFDSVLVAKFDASTHTAPKQFNVEGFPTLYFVPGDRSKSPIPYDGNRDAKEMISFIKRHATTPI